MTQSKYEKKFKKKNICTPENQFNYSYSLFNVDHSSNSCSLVLYKENTQIYMTLLDVKIEENLDHFKIPILKKTYTNSKIKYIAPYRFYSYKGIYWVPSSCTCDHTLTTRNWIKVEV